MKGKFRMVRDGVPIYCAPWVGTLSPAARAMSYIKPDGRDPVTQLGLDIPDMGQGDQMPLDFAMPCKARPMPSKSAPDLHNEMLAALIALTDWMRDNTGPRDGCHDVLVAAMATIRKAST